jgi:hypothetical protein
MAVLTGTGAEAVAVPPGNQALKKLLVCHTAPLFFSDEIQRGIHLLRKRPPS